MKKEKSGIFLQIPPGILANEAVWLIYLELTERSKNIVFIALKNKMKKLQKICQKDTHKTCCLACRQ